MFRKKFPNYQHVHVVKELLTFKMASTIRLYIDNSLILFSSCKREVLKYYLKMFKC